jgi:hypothetical protein
LYKFVRDRQDGSEVDFDFEPEQNSTNRSIATKTKSNNRLSVNNRSSPQTVTNSELQTTMFSLEKKEFDYDFVSLFIRIWIINNSFRI